MSRDADILKKEEKERQAREDSILKYKDRAIAALKENGASEDSITDLQWRTAAVEIKHAERNRNSNTILLSVLGTVWAVAFAVSPNAVYAIGSALFLGLAAYCCKRT